LNPDEVELTIIVPVFNRSEALKRAVDSIVSQCDRISVIIVDDGSAPEHAAVADEIAASGGDAIQVVRQPNRGPAAARNAGLAVTRSRFVMFLDSDDALAETAITAIDRPLLRCDDVGLLSGAVQIMRPGEAPSIAYPTVVQGVPWARISVHSGSFATRTDIARAIGGYDEALRFAENTDFVLRLADECSRRSLRVLATDVVFSIYHHGAPDERRYDAKRLDAALHLLRRGRFDLHPRSARAKLHAIVAVNAARVGRYGVSVKHATLAAIIEPRNPHHLVRLALSLTGPLGRRRWLRR
jgi:glycosyltransferase involved in cell wall biosynthesis